MNEEKKTVPETTGAQQGASTKAIVAWILGKQELNAIARGESSAQGRGMAMAGYILGIVGVVLVAIAIILTVVVALSRARCVGDLCVGDLIEGLLGVLR